MKGPEQKLLSGVGERADFILFASRSKVLPNFLEGAPESLSRRQRAESQHRIVSLLDAPVVSLNPPVQVSATAMLHLWTECFPDRSWIRIVAIGGDLCRRHVHH